MKELTKTPKMSDMTKSDIFQLYLNQKDEKVE